MPHEALEVGKRDAAIFVLRTGRLRLAIGKLCQGDCGWLSSGQPLRERGVGFSKKNSPDEDELDQNPQSVSRFFLLVSFLHFRATLLNWVRFRVGSAYH